MRKIFSLAAIATTFSLVAAAFSPNSASAQNYVEMKPLAEVLAGASVRDCRGGEGQNVTMITWGADIFTLHANGASLTTQPGSIFADEGLTVTLKREDVFAKQVEAYLRCDTPYLRGTLGQINLASDITAVNPGTEMVPIIQLSWSNGGDALVAKKGINKPADLKGKTIVVQAYGPHVAYLNKVLADAGLTPNDVTIVYTKDLVGFDDDTTPGSAFLDDPNIDAAMVIIPDALKLTSGGTGGTGAENSFDGAEIMLSTKSASRVIADVYVVRKDYLEANRDEVQKFVHALLVAEESLRKLVLEKDTRTDEYNAIIVAAAGHLLDAPTDIDDTEGMYADAETIGFAGNKKFFENTKYPRNVTKLTSEIQTAYVQQGMLAATASLGSATWNYDALKAGITNTIAKTTPKFNADKLAAAVTNMASSGALDDGTLFEFQINFQPNQNTFSTEIYGDAFNKVVELASTYAGAVITIEGHSDPANFLKKMQKGAGEGILNRIRQSAKNLSVSRSTAVRKAVLDMAAASGVPMDPSQFVTIGYGISNPATGVCQRKDEPLCLDAGLPKYPANKAEWLSNMRVVFKIVNVEGESSAFESF